MKVIYVAHPVGCGEDRDANLERARRWLAWLLVAFPDWALNISWLPYCEVMDESPPNRDRGMRDNFAQIRQCDAIVLVGGRVSDGMQRELRAARSRYMDVIDLTSLGSEPPSLPSDTEEVETTEEQTNADLRGAGVEG